MKLSAALWQSQIVPPHHTVGTVSANYVSEFPSISQKPFLEGEGDANDCNEHQIFYTLRKLLGMF